VLAPGLIDLQVNGGGGLMLGGADVAGLARIAATHARLGATAILPTLITDTPEATQHAIAAAIAAVVAGVPGVLGLHLEGPHLGPRRKGAHDAHLIRPMTDADLALYLDAARALPRLMITLAPEAASLDQIAALAGAGVIVSLGHSDTGMEGALAAIGAGASAVTHLFNAMSPLGHREPGLVGAALDTDVFAGLIGDGVHVGATALRVALVAKRGAGRLFLVSDAMAVAGTDASEFTLGARQILRRDGRLTLGDGTLAGADYDLAAGLRHLVDAMHMPLDRALSMVTTVPANVIGRDDIGHLRPGARADMVHLDADLVLRQVWQAGAALRPAHPS
jgi:N-acetylglucosamine-6-phosphate deacetylase